MTQFGSVLRQVLAKQEVAAQGTDGELLQRFTTTHDEMAFTALVHRHGPMILGVCQRILGDVNAAEDAFQATFLALVRRANRLDQRATLSSWLYTVAYHAAVRARSDAARRHYQERQAVTMTRVQSMTDPAQTELRTVIDQELTRLPEKYRAPLVLCYLEGKTNLEAAQLLGWTKGTVSGRLARARELLNTRLTKRGMALSAVGLGVLATNSVVSASLVDATVSTAILSVTGKTVTGPIAAIAEGALQSMTISKIKITAVALFVVTTAVIGGFFVSANAHTPTRTSHSLVALTPLPDEPKAELAKDVKVELNAKGELVVGERQLSKLEEIEDHLTKLFKQDARANENTILVVRIPGTAESAVVRPFLYLANRVGFARIRLITADRTVRQSLPIEYAPEPDRSPDVTVIAKSIKVGDDAGGLEGAHGTLEAKLSARRVSQWQWMSRHKAPWWRVEVCRTAEAY